MANYTNVVTDDGLGLIGAVISSEDTLLFTKVEAGDGALGATDPTTLEALIGTKQTFNVIDARQDGSENWYVYFVLSNEGLEAGYLRREVGLFGRKASDPASEVLLAYLYAPTDEDADFVAVPENGVALIDPFRIQLSQARAASTSVTVDNSTVFLSLDRWDQHLAGAGGVDQHAAATAADPGLMSAADKSKLDAHINTVTPSGGAAHAAATQAAAGFLSAADKTKLDGIEASADANVAGYGKVRVGGVDVPATIPNDRLDLIPGANIAIAKGADPKTIVVAATGITPSSHIGTGGAAHAVASPAVAGFESAADKSKLDGIAAGAEVNQNAFAKVQVGGTDVNAGAKTDRLILSAGTYIQLTPDPVSKTVQIGVIGLVDHNTFGQINCNGQEILADNHADAFALIEGGGIWMDPSVGSDSITIGLKLPHYALLRNYGFAGALADLVAHANTKAAGMAAAPGGGVTVLGSGLATVLEMQVRNLQDYTVEPDVYVLWAEGALSYQVDDGAVTALLAEAGSNVTVGPQIPPGEHRLRFLVAGGLVLADWLTADVVWVAGGTYY